jgi:hypothetical protein
MGNLNGVQLLVLGFLSVVWLSLIAILAAAPDIYDLPAGNSGLAEPVFLGGLSAFILFVAFGVIRRWRWLFWLLLVAFLSGLLRVPASIFELAGWIPATGPSWYVVLQAFIGVVQFAIGLLLLLECRRSGVWGRRN